MDHTEDFVTRLAAMQAMTWEHFNLLYYFRLFWFSRESMTREHDKPLLPYFCRLLNQHYSTKEIAHPA